MDEERLPQKMLEWYPPERRREGRPREFWMQEGRAEMRKMGINNMEWIDREE